MEDNIINSQNEFNSDFNNQEKGESSLSPIWKNETVLDIETFNDFNKYTTRKVMIFICLIFPVVFLILALLKFFSSEPDITMGITYLVSGGIWTIVFPLIFKKQSMKKKNIPDFITNGTKSIYEFFEDKMLISEYFNGEKTGFAEIKYNTIRKVCLYKTYTFIYISNVQAYILREENMSADEKKNFIEFIKSKNIIVK